MQEHAGVKRPRSIWFVLWLAALVPLLGGCQRPDAAASAPGITAVCKGGTLTVCPRDAKLVFRVNGLSGQFFLTAFAEDITSGEKYWIAPNAQDDPTPVTVRAGEQVLSQVVPLSLLAMGTYRVRALLTQEPLERKDLSGPKINSAADSTTLLTVTRSTGRAHSVFE
jgi:hypothetical protein